MSRCPSRQSCPSRSRGGRAPRRSDCCGAARATSQSTSAGSIRSKVRSAGRASAGIASPSGSQSSNVLPAGSAAAHPGAGPDRGPPASSDTGPLRISRCSENARWRWRSPPTPRCGRLGAGDDARASQDRMVMVSLDGRSAVRPRSARRGRPATTGMATGPRTPALPFVSSRSRSSGHTSTIARVSTGSSGQNRRLNKWPPLGLLASKRRYRS